MQHRLSAYTFLLAFAPAIAVPKNYYFAAAGLAGNTGVSASSPWPFSKLAPLTLAAGDSILFKRGDTFPGNVTANQSGLPGAEIVYAAYGTGPAPILDGSVAVSGWTLYSAGVYQANCPITDPSFIVEQAFQDGLPLTLARFPNTGYLKVSLGGTNGIKLDATGLAGNTTDWTGASAHFRRLRYAIDSRPVSAYDVTQRLITLGTPLIGPAPAGWGMFFNNKLEALDAPGEWYFSASSRKIYAKTMGSDDPNLHSMRISALSSGFYASSRSYLRVQGLRFSNYSWRAVRLLDCNHMTVTDLQVDYAGETGMDLRGPDLTVRGNFINGAVTQGISMVVCYPNCSSVRMDAKLTDNVVRGTGALNRLGRNGYQADGTNMGIGIWIHGNGNILSRNVVESSAYIGIQFTGLGTLIEENVISNSCMVLDDGGAIYTFDNGFPGTSPSDNSIIRKNVILHSVGNGAGVLGGGTAAEGIYMDEHSQNILISENTVFDAGVGVYLHDTRGIQVESNTFYGNRSAQAALSRDYYMPSEEMFGNQLKDNILFSLSSSIPKVQETTNLDPQGCLQENQGNPCQPQIQPLATYVSNYRCQETTTGISCTLDGSGWTGSYTVPSALAVRQVNTVKKFSANVSDALWPRDPGYFLVRQMPDYQSKVVLKNNPPVPPFLRDSDVAAWVEPAKPQLSQIRSLLLP